MSYSSNLKYESFSGFTSQILRFTAFLCFFTIVCTVGQTKKVTCNDFFQKPKCPHCATEKCQNVERNVFFLKH